MPGRFLPKKWRVPQVNGVRGLALLLGGFYCFARAWAYGPAAAGADLPSGLQLIAAPLSIEVWAIVWAVVGVLAIFGAFRPDRDYLAWGLVVGMMAAWAFAYLLGWTASLTTPEPSREWLTVTTYAFPAAMLWLLSLRRRSEPLPRSTDAA